MDAALVGGDTELAALITSIKKGHGAVLVGPAGIGKTRLVLEATSGLKRQVWWMAVSVDSASIPYGAFHPLVRELGEARQHSP